MRVRVCSASVERVRLERDDARRRAESLSRVIELISSELTLQPLLTRIVESAVQLMDATCGNVGLVRERPDGPIVEMAAVVNLPHRVLSAEYTLDTGLSGRVVRQQRPLVLDRYGDLGEIPVEEIRDLAVIGIPIWWGHRIIGVFAIGAPPPRRFSEDDVETLTLFARHAAIAIENARLFESEQRQHETTQLLYRTSRRISTAMTLDEVTRAYLEAVAVGSPYTTSANVYEPDATGGRQIRSLRGTWDDERGMVFDGAVIPFSIMDGLEETLAAGETVVMRDCRTDPRASEELRRAQAAVGRPSLALIPLIAQGRHLGVVGLSHPIVHDWSAADLRPYQTTAAQLATAIDSRQQHLLLAERGHQLAILEERRRLARELHDSVTQTLFGMSLLAQTVPDLWELDRAEARRSLDQIRDLTRGALAEMRALLFELRPADEERADLGRALRRHAQWLEQWSGLTVTLELDERASVPPGLVQPLFRIAQEALANVARHARARTATVSLEGGQGLRLTVRDDGQGFDPSVVPDGHLGLISMRERADEIGARLRVESTIGGGTRVEVEWAGTDAAAAEGT